MPTMILDDLSFTWNAKDLSAYVRRATLDYGADIQDASAMGVGGKQKKGGLLDWSLSVELNQDWGATPAPDVDLFDDVGVERAVTVRPDKTAAISATNPDYTGQGILETYPPLGNAVGELATTTINIQGTGLLVRDITP